MIHHISASASDTLDSTSKYHIRIYNVNIFELITPQNKKIKENIHNLEDLSPMFDDKSEAYLWFKPPFHTSHTFLITFWTYQ